MENISTIQEQLNRIERNSILSTKRVLTLSDVAILTGLSRSYLYKLTCKHKIPHYKPSGKGIYFDKNEVEQWLLQNRIATDAELEAKAISFRRV